MKGGWMSEGDDGWSGRRCVIVHSRDETRSLVRRHESK